MVTATESAIAPRGAAAIDRGVLPTTEVVARVHRVQEIMRSLMKENVHFGTIPGTPKPTLYKPGAEILLMTFRIAVEPGRIEDLSTLDEVRYRVTQRATNQVTGEILGEAAGECSSSETKYRWVKPVCDEEWDETDPAHRREKWMKGGNDGPYKQKQIRSSPADVANTILKMASKRALIALTLQTLAASDIFSQDLEDLDEQLRDSLGDQAPKKPAMSAPQQRTTTSTGAAANQVTGKVQTIDEKKGTGKKGPWTKWSIKVDDKWHGTFDAKHRQTADDARSAGLPVTITFTTTQYGRDVEKIAIVEAAAATPATDTPAAAATTPAANGQLPIERQPGEDD